jgi:hypothetical protein
LLSTLGCTQRAGQGNKQFSTWLIIPRWSLSCAKIRYAIEMPLQN